LGKSRARTAGTGTLAQRPINSQGPRISAQLWGGGGGFSFTKGGGTKGESGQEGKGRWENKTIKKKNEVARGGYLKKGCRNGSRCHIKLRESCNESGSKPSRVHRFTGGERKQKKQRLWGATFKQRIEERANQGPFLLLGPMTRRGGKKKK